MYFLRESILHELNNVRYWHAADVVTHAETQQGIVHQQGASQSHNIAAQRLVLRLIWCKPGQYQR